MEEATYPLEDGDGDGEEAARCAFLKWGGTYVDFVPLIPREAVEGEYEGLYHEPGR